MDDVLRNIGEIATGKEAIKVQVDIKNDDLMKIIIGVVVALSVTIAIGVILAKKLN